MEDKTESIVPVKTSYTRVSEAEHRISKCFMELSTEESSAYDTSNNFLANSLECLSTLLKTYSPERYKRFPVFIEQNSLDKYDQSLDWIEMMRVWKNKRLNGINIMNIKGIQRSAPHALIYSIQKDFSSTIAIDQLSSCSSFSMKTNVDKREQSYSLITSHDASSQTNSEECNASLYLVADSEPLIWQWRDGIMPFRYNSLFQLALAMNSSTDLPKASTEFDPSEELDYTVDQDSHFVLKRVLAIPNVDSDVDNDEYKGLTSENLHNSQTSEVIESHIPLNFKNKSDNALLDTAGKQQYLCEKCSFEKVCYFKDVSEEIKVEEHFFPLRRATPLDDIPMAIKLEFDEVSKACQNSRNCLNNVSNIPTKPVGIIVIRDSTFGENEVHTKEERRSRRTCYFAGGKKVLLCPRQNSKPSRRMKKSIAVGTTEGINPNSSSDRCGGYNNDFAVNKGIQNHGGFIFKRKSIKMGKISGIVKRIRYLSCIDNEK